jgi:hypothetical protein
MTTVPDAGAGPSTFFDIGALEYTGADSCSPPLPGTFIRGEANGDGSVDLADAVRILLVLFNGEPTDCRDALDTNDDGALNITDPIRLLDYLFAGGPAPLAPFPAEGQDSSADSLDCQRS